MELFCQQLRLHARKLGLSSAEVARRAGISERRYAYYVTGDREPDLRTLLRISIVLGVTPNDLLMEAAEVEPLISNSKEAERTIELERYISSFNEVEKELAFNYLELLYRYSELRRRLKAV